MWNKSDNSNIGIKYKIISKENKKRIKNSNNKHIISNRSNNIRSNKHRLTDTKTTKHKYLKCSK